jgi:putative pyrroloquinoline-quinone binding quinoprotein
MTRPWLLVSLLVAHASIALPATAHAWQFRLPGSHFIQGPQEGLTVALHPSGDVIASGILGQVGDPSSPPVILRLSAATGALVWRQDPTGMVGNFGFLGLAIDPAGDVVFGNGLSETVAKLAAGDGSTLWQVPGSHVLAVVGSDVVVRDGDHVKRIQGSDGAETWTYDFGGFPLSIAIDSGGDVFVVGVNPPTGFLAARLTGSTGAEVWRRDDPLSLGADRLVVDAAGDLVIGSILGNVRKVRGSDGADVWSVPGSVLAIAVDAAGDVAAGGNALTKRRGTDGTPLWSSSVPYGIGALAFDPSGDLVVAGEVLSPFTGPDAALAKVAGDTGEEIWRRVLQRPTSALDFDENFALALGGNGTVWAATGTVAYRDLVVLRYSEPIAGQKLAVIDRAGNPATRRVVAKSKGPGVVVATPGGPADPTIAGARLDLENPTSGESDSFTLPAANWTALGSPPGSRGYLYSDTTLASGPCRTVRIGNRHDEGLIGAVCHGAQIAFSLDEASQGSLQVVLTTGSAHVVRHCMQFGGTVVNDRPGNFTVRNAPQPDACL